MITFDATIVKVQRSFIKIKTQNIFFEIFNIHISHLTLHSMINMALKWHHKNISKKITIFIEFWRSLDMLFALFDCDYTQKDYCLVIGLLLCVCTWFDLFFFIGCPMTIIKGGVKEINKGVM